MITDVLAVLCPSEDDTALLTACLKNGEEARSAWNAWRSRRDASADHLRTELAARRNLMPLLERSVARNGLRVESELVDYIRAAVLREELRTERFRRIAAGVLTGVQRAGATPYVSRGVALATTVYDAWAHRHCHDLDILVAADQLDCAAAGLKSTGLRQIDVREAARLRGAGHMAADAVLHHESGLYVVLHTRPFGPTFYDVPVARFMEGGERACIDDVAVRIPSAEALLVHVLGHATYSSAGRNLRWVTDAWQLSIRRPDIDWDEFAKRLDASRLTLPVSVLLHYLAEFGMVIPRELLEDARQRASTAPAIAQDVALGGALAACGGDLALLWRCARSPRGRARLVRWMAAPTPAYVRGTFPDRPALPLLLCYLYRPMRFIGGRLERREVPAAPAAIAVAGARGRRRLEGRGAADA